MSKSKRKVKSIYSSVRKPVIDRCNIVTKIERVAKGRGSYTRKNKYGKNDQENCD